jgi:hypothetical protein
MRILLTLLCLLQEGLVSLLLRPSLHLSELYLLFPQMAQRFTDLGIDSLVIARMDVTDDAPPPHLHFLEHKLPTVVLLPADDKTQPWNFYSGVGKVQTMMKWVEKHVSLPFTLPNLPHLKESDRVAYKTQVREREEYLEEKRKKDQEAMEEEEKQQQQLFETKLRNWEEEEAPELVLKSNQEAEEEEPSRNSVRGEDEL